MKDWYSKWTADINFCYYKIKKKQACNFSNCFEKKKKISSTEMQDISRYISWGFWQMWTKYKKWLLK